MSTCRIFAYLREFRARAQPRLASLGRRLVHNLAIASEALRFAAPLCSLVGVLTLTAVVAAAAQVDYPNRPITLIVPFPAGGPSDVVGRIVSEHMSRTLGRPILVENVLGAGGTIGTLRAARAAADGHTIVLGHMGTHATAVSLYSELAYRPATDFEAIGLIAGFAVVVVARKDFPASDLKEFTHYARANASKLNNAHAGLSSVAYAACLQFNSLLRIEPTLIPYQGAAPFTTALLAGQVDYVCDQVLNSAPHVRSGNIKAFAISSSKRSAALPHVPTTGEAGLPEFQFSAWNAFFAPKGTPRPIIETLNAALQKALDDDKVRARLTDMGADIASLQQRSPQWLATFVEAEVARWTKLLKKEGATTNTK